MNTARRRRWAVGTWRPATLVRSDIFAIKLLLAEFAAIRAMDYATSVTRADVNGWIESSMPAEMWATLCGLTAAALIIGIALRIHCLVWAGHCIGAITYAALAVGALQYTLSLEPWDEWRRIGPLAIISSLHLLLAMRSGPTPLEHDSTSEVTVERAVCPRTT